MKKQIFSAISAISVLIVVIPMVVRGAPSVPHFEVDPSFPQLPAGKVFGDMSSVTVDAQDHVWMIHRPRDGARRAAHERDAAGRRVRLVGQAA